MIHFKHGNRTILQGKSFHVFQIIVHQRINAVIICWGGKYNVAVFEAVGNQFGYMGLGKLCI